MTAAIIHFPRRYVEPTAEEAARGSANDSDLVASFADSTRRGDVIGEILRAAAPRNGSGRGAKAIGKPIDFAERARVLAEEQVTAFTAGMLQAAEHGAHSDLVAALDALARVMDGRHGEAARQRVAALRAGLPMPSDYVAKLRWQMLQRREKDSGRPAVDARAPQALRERLNDGVRALLDLAGFVERGGAS